MSIEIVSLAESIAREAHEGQLYAPGLDYVETHVEPVAKMIRMMGYGPMHESVGWLHDVPEDCGVTLEDLRAWGVPDPVVTSVGFLTKIKGENIGEYRMRVARDPMAIVCKFADSSKNLEFAIRANVLAPVPEVPLPKFNKRIVRYAGNIAFFEPRLPSKEDLALSA
jgi:(p)ppGpp synthase/HD superfamily hydrolase